MSYKVAYIETHVKKMLANSQKAMVAKIKQIIESGAIDLANYDTTNNSMVLPKAIVMALLETEAKQYEAKGTAFEKQIKQDVKNIKCFI